MDTPPDGLTQDEEDLWRETVASMVENGCAPDRARAYATAAVELARSGGIY